MNWSYDRHGKIIEDSTKSKEFFEVESSTRFFDKNPIIKKTIESNKEIQLIDDNNLLCTNDE